MSMTNSIQNDRAKCSSQRLSQGLVVTLLDSRSGSYLQFPSTQRIHSWSSVAELKDKITEEQGYPQAIQRLYLHNQELDDDLEMKDIMFIERVDPFQEVRLDIILAVKISSPVPSGPCQDRSQATHQPQTGIVPYGTLPVPSQMQNSLELIRTGFESGLSPCLTEEGTSGAYMLQVADDEEIVRPVGFWKPIDEEPFAPNNPRGMCAPFGSETCRPGVKSGESSLREVIAYLLDHEGFSSVPPTALVEVSHPSLRMTPFSDRQVTTPEFKEQISGLLAFRKQQRTSNMKLGRSNPNSHNLIDPEISTQGARSKRGKLGSMQLFVQNVGPIENFSPSLIHKEEVHKIAVLDLRLLNIDRNACNILVQKSDSGLTLVPIDHGLTLPDSLAVQSFDLAWLSFPQVEEPFSVKALDYIQRLDIDEDIRLIERTFKVRPECLRNIKITTLLLKEAAAKGLNLSQIGQILCRPDDDETIESLLENIVNKAELCANLRVQQQRKFKNSMVSLIDEQSYTNIGACARNSLTEPFALESTQVARPLKCMPKRNSFNEQTTQCDADSPLLPPSEISLAIQASIAAESADDDCESPTLFRRRGISEGDDNLSINVLNANTQGMILHKLGQLQRQTSAKKQSDVTSDEEAAEMPELLDFQLHREISAGMQADVSNHKELGLNASYPMPTSMRRATSYNEAQIHDSTECEISGCDVAECLIAGTTTLTGKHRRLLQAKQAFIKYQLAETSSYPGSFKQQRTKATARKLLAQGGPHDEEFFHCFKIYLSEALNQFTAM